MLPIVLVRTHELNTAIETKKTDEGAHGYHEDGRKEEKYHVRATDVMTSLTSTDEMNALRHKKITKIIGPMQKEETAMHELSVVIETKDIDEVGPRHHEERCKKDESMKHAQLSAPSSE